jgi:hypothetical protein
MLATGLIEDLTPILFFAKLVWIGDKSEYDSE